MVLECAIFSGEEIESLEEEIDDFLSKRRLKAKNIFNTTSSVALDSEDNPYIVIVIFFEVNKK